MDSCPNVTELLHNVRLYRNKINKLAKHLEISVEDNIKGKDRLEVVFKKWIDRKGDEATRRNMLKSLVDIKEREIADTYHKHITTIKECTEEFSSIFKNVQAEDAEVDICVMQCMPLGPPRVGKTCLKKRLLKEDLSKFCSGSRSPSTPIVEEKQTILVESPVVLTLDAKSTNWKHIPWENEVLHLIQKFKNVPQSLVNSIKSLDWQKTRILEVFALALSLLFFSFRAHQWLMCFFAFVSFIMIILMILFEAIQAMRFYKTLTFSILYVIQLLTLTFSYPTKKFIVIIFVLFVIHVINKIAAQQLNSSAATYISNTFAIIHNILYYLGYVDEIGQPIFVFGVLLLLTEIGITNSINDCYVMIICQLVIYHADISFYVISIEVMQTVLVYGILHDKQGRIRLRRLLQFFWFVTIICTALFLAEFSVLMLWTDIYTILVFLFFFDNKRIVNPDDKSKSDIVKKALESISTRVSKFSNNNLDGSLKIYFTDSGGQPEFQEVLPALLSGPSVFFFVFNLSKPFDTKYEVEYVDSNYSQFIPYQTQYTVMDTLLQCLASISCLGEYSKTPTKENIGIKPKVFFIGTHRDLVKKAIVMKMEKELTAAIKKTTWYKKDIIEFASAENLIFSVDNFDKTDSSFIDVRKAIENLSQSGYKIKIRARWLGLELMLRDHKESVISVSECEKIAEECSITNKNDLKDALWFLHNKVGSIRHYQQIPELKDVVITKPQLLFTIVTDLLVSTFPFASGKVNSTFQEKGIFTRDDLQKIGKIDKTGLTVTQVIALLCYLHILAPLKQDTRGNRDYLLPCALSHAPKRLEKAQLKGNILLPALLIGFKCGYTPKGVFGALISYLLQHTQAGVKWVLDEEQMFRDQATFIIGNTGYSLIISYLPKYLQLELCEPRSSGGLVDSNNYSNMIRSCFSNGLKAVCKRLNYTCETEPVFGFYCSCSTSEKRHPAFFMSKRSTILTCDKYRSTTFIMNISQRKWFSNAQLTYMMILTFFKKVFFWFMRQKFVWLIGGIVSLISFIVLIPTFFGVMNFDLHQLNMDYSDVKAAQINHYTTLCDRDSFPNSLPCKLMNIAKRNNSASSIKPIRLWINSTKNYMFDDIQSNCSFTIIASLNCYPDCSNVFREIQNGFINYLRSCPLSSEICWPIIHNIAGFKPYDNLKLIIADYFKINAEVNSVLQIWYRFYYLPSFGKNCTKDVISVIDAGENINFKKFLSILKFVQYTFPDLSPLLILKNIDKAASETKFNNLALIEILETISKKASSSNWLIPIIAFSNNKYQHELVKKHFPYNMIVE